MLHHGLLCYVIRCDCTSATYNIVCRLRSGIRPDNQGFPNPTVVAVITRRCSMQDADAKPPRDPFPCIMSTRLYFQYLYIYFFSIPTNSLFTFKRRKQDQNRMWNTFQFPDRLKVCAQMRKIENCSANCTLSTSESET